MEDSDYSPNSAMNNLDKLFTPADLERLRDILSGCVDITKDIDNITGAK